MKKTLILAIALAASSFSSLSRADETPVLKSLKLTLPYSSDEFPGADSGAANNNCRACHSADFVMSQPNLSKATWDAEVKKMMNVMKAPISPEDATAIVNYLTEIKGAK